MQMKPLGRTGLSVTDHCLGTMTFGTQTREADAHAQIDAALAHGLNFVDTAEMYPVNPVRAETVGRTEEIIGNWNAKNPARRGEYVLATKVSGSGLKAVRDGIPISRATINEAFESSLRRLRTDYIDLYQLHWPNRGSYHFRQIWDYDPSAQNRADTIAHIDEVLDTCAGLIREGKLRAVGLSNESAWGTTQWVARAEATGGPRVASIQNEYSLLCRQFDSDLAEVAVNEDVGCLAFSPLGTGLLTGKYRGGAVPEGSRMALSGTLGGRATPRVGAAVEAYLEIAAAHDLDPVHMALAFCAARPFMTSVIFGATTLPQLERILAGTELVLSDEVLGQISQAHRAHPMPY